HKHRAPRLSQLCGTGFGLYIWLIGSLRNPSALLLPGSYFHFPGAVWRTRFQLDPSHVVRCRVGPVRWRSTDGFASLSLSGAASALEFVLRWRVFSIEPAQPAAVLDYTAGSAGACEYTDAEGKILASGLYFRRRSHQDARSPL